MENFKKKKKENEMAKKKNKFSSSTEAVCSDYDKYKREEEERESKRNSYNKQWVIPKNGCNVYRMIPALAGTEMKDNPIVRMMVHFNVGPKKEFLRCERDDLNDPKEKCFLDAKASKYYAMANEAKKASIKKKYEDKAKEHTGTRRWLMQVVDFSCFYKYDDELELPVLLKKKVQTAVKKKCLFKFDKNKDKCQSCKFGSACKGVQLFYSPKTVYEDLAKGAKRCLKREKINIVDFEEGRNFMVYREGEGQFGTRYKSEVLSETFPLDPVFIKIIGDQAQDLTNIDPKLGNKRIEEIYSGKAYDESEEDEDEDEAKDEDETEDEEVDEVEEEDEDEVEEEDEDEVEEEDEDEVEEDEDEVEEEDEDEVEEEDEDEVEEEDEDEDLADIKKEMDKVSADKKKTKKNEKTKKTSKKRKK